MLFFCPISWLLNKIGVLLVKFEDINTEKEAKTMLRQEVYLPKELLSETDINKIIETSIKAGEFSNNTNIFW